MFSEGNIIVLESQATQKSLRISNGDVEGIGGRGKLAQFIVHVRRPSVVALQNAGNTDHWLGMVDDKLIGTVILYQWVVLVSPAPQEDDLCTVQGTL